MEGHEQRVSQPDNWLHDGAEDYTRQFVKVIYLPEGIYWAECTNEEKEQWEREHPQPEPPQDEA